jgi:serine/threonine protein kinase
MAFAGRGSYGTVTVDGNRAIKKFKKLSHITQESIAAIFLKDQKHIVQFMSANFYEKKMVMQRHSKTLRKWMDFESDNERPVKQKVEVIKQTLKGLINIHSLKLVHGDIKPGNILVDEDPLYVVIADLGFISLRPFSKVERTAAVYRDKIVKSCHGHDIYSMAIIMLELFGELKMSFQATYDQIHAAINKEIKDELSGKYPIPPSDFRKLLIEMTDSYHESRPTTKMVYYALFGEKIDNKFIEYNYEIKKSEEIPEIKKTMKNLSKKYDIERANRGYKAVVLYINKYYHHSDNNKKKDDKKDDKKEDKRDEKRDEKISKRKYLVFSVSMIFILSSLFGKQNKFNETMAADYADVNENEIISTVQKLSLNREIVNILMHP